MPAANSNAYRLEKNSIVTLIKQDCLAEAGEALAPLVHAHPDDHELHYFAGMICEAQHRYADAARSFEEALALNINYGDAWFEMGVIQMILCRFNQAAGYLKKAKAQRCRVAEVRSFLKKIERVVHPEDVTLSACLIVKNEEKHLSTCLKSLEAICDEIVVVDTGSEDDTVPIAEAFGAKIFHYVWRKDFSAARNFAIKQASGDWIIQLDADEELFPEDQHKVREVIHQGKCAAAYLALHNRVSNSFGESEPSVHYLVRLFRNRPDFYYENAIHEILKTTGKVIPVDINILHHGYNLDDACLEEKRKRNADILYRRLKDDPESVTTLFYLCMMHLGNHEYELAEPFARQALAKMDADNPNKQHLYLMTLNNLAMIANQKNDLDAVKRHCHAAIEINDNYLDPYFFLGMAYFKASELDEAAEIFRNYVAKNEELAERPVFNLFGSCAGTYLFRVHHFLGRIYRRQGDNDAAKEMFLKSFELNPKFWIGLLDLAYIYRDEEEWLQAVDSFDKAIRLARTNPEVNEKNKELWFDFMNAIKSYTLLLNQIKEKQLAPVA